MNIYLQAEIVLDRGRENNYFLKVIHGLELYLIGGVFDFHA